MSEAEAVVESRPPAPLSPVNALAAVIFAAGATLFVLFFVYRYTTWQSGHFYDVLLGLWGLYWPVALGWGALRIRPRGRGHAIYQALLWMVLAQGLCFVFGWGSALIESPTPAIGWSMAVAFFAGPALAIAILFFSRRWLVLAIAELLGPLLFLALWKFGG
jgi:hypothetical protein